MTKSELYYFASKCLIIHEHPEFVSDIIDAFKNDLIDWVQFITICSDNLILPTIYLRFRSHGLLEYLPKEVAEHLKEIYDLNFQRNNEILRQIKSINETLKTRDVIPLYLKGAGNLIDNIYSDIGERLMGDIDFLVQEEDFFPSISLMLDAGYLNYMNSTYINIRETQHYPRIYNTDFAADVEIHRIPNEYDCGNWFNNKVIYDERKTLNIQSKCYVESDKHKILHNFIHSQLDNEGFLFGNIRLRDIYDIFLISKRYSLNEILLSAKFQRKATAYFAFAKNAFDLDNNFFKKKNFSYKILKIRQHLNLNYKLFYKVNKGLILSYIYFRDKKGYYGKLIHLFSSK
ncbi:MAG: nucleotidyltransferase family protein [Draconibacterium sp.]